MTLRIVLHPAAVREVQEARRYYAEIGLGLRDAFEDELQSVLERAQRFPQSGRAWGPADPGRRVYVLERFPYLVIVRIRSSELRVLAVAHQRRRPEYWLRRDR